MHLLAATPGAVDDGSEAVDLAQTPGEIVVLSAADTEIACLAAAQSVRQNVDTAAPSVRLANYLRLGHNLSVDLYTDQVIANAKLVIVRLLGGRGYWTYGVDEIAAACAAADIPVAFLPGDEQPDAELTQLTTLDAPSAHRLWQYLVQGGTANAESFLAFAATLIGHDAAWREPAPLLRAGLYWPGAATPTLGDLQSDWQPDAPVAAIIFYRALLQAANLAVVDGLIAHLQEAGLNPLPIYANSLKDPVAAATLAQLLADAPPAVILNTTGFALTAPGGDANRGPFAETDAPVLQVVFAGSDEAGWRAGTNGLAARDIAMNVALPEVDGRLLARAVSFKGRARRDPATETDVTVYQPVADRLAFTAKLAAAWAELRTTSADNRKVALVLANYPNRDGRLGNGVGLDTPAATMTVLNALATAGYRLANLPHDSAALMDEIAAGPTNAAIIGRDVRETLPLPDYEQFFTSLPAMVREQVYERWGPP
ncbi:MAG: cobaltochelatase subunit CobN, partial [Alphaproteobacteria bacterium]|nr:cobaltochelatase subunit CobN [Alphaproteobacteria bacterium]